jgi:hypothetical protein
MSLESLYVNIIRMINPNKTFLSIQPSELKYDTN